MELLAAVKQLRQSAEAAEGVLADLANLQKAKQQLTDEVRAMEEHKLKVAKELKAALEQSAEQQNELDLLRKRVKDLQAALAKL